MSLEVRTYDAVIVGAGADDDMAIHFLTKAGVKCLVLEAGGCCPLCGLLISGVTAALDNGVADILRYLVAIKEILFVS